MKRITYVSCVSLLALCPALAVPQATTATTNDLGFSQAIAADRFIAIVMENLPKTRDSIKALMQTMSPAGPGKAIAFDRALDRLDMDVVRSAMKKALVRNFTTEELDALADFQKSMTGRSVAKKAPVYLHDFMVLLQKELLVSASGDQTTLKLGLVGPLTGEAASFGLSEQKGAELAVQDWNEKGGVLGKQIVLVSADDKADPAEGATAFTNLIMQDGVVAIIGPIMSKVALAGSPICQASGVPMLSPTATNPKVTRIGNFIFRACFIDPFQGTVGAKFAFEELKTRKAACLFDVGNDYTRSLSEAFEAKYTSLGGAVVAFEGHATGTRDFRATLIKILATEPEMIYVSDYYNDAAQIAKQVRSLGFKGPLVGGDGWDSPKLAKLGGDAVEGCFYTNHYASDDASPVVQEFNKKFRVASGLEPDAISVLGYDATNIMLDAVRRAGSAEGPAIRNALEATGTPTVCGNVRFDTNRDPVKPAVILQIRGGKPIYFTTVNP